MKALRYNPHLYMLTIVAIILSFMASITPLWAKSGSIIEVCSTLGTRSVIIDETGTPIPATPKLKKNCILCLLASTDTLPIPDFEISNHLSAVKKKTTHWDEKNQALKFKAIQNYSARAPPTLS